MEITKEQIKELLGTWYGGSGVNKRIEEKLKEILPKAFEPEYRECELYPLHGEDSRWEESNINTINWRIFDGDDKFFVVNEGRDEGRDTVYRFDKKGDCRWYGDDIDDFNNWLKSQKKDK